MPVKSTSTQFGTFAVSLHWLSAIVILAALILGMRLEDTTDPAQKIALLKLHAPLGLAVGVLTLIRIVWWLALDTKPPPAPATPRSQHIAASVLHGLIYVLLLAMAASGMAMMAMSGAGDIISGASPGPLPDFFKYAPRIPHGIGAKLLIILLIGHVGAALYHQFVQKDGLLRRMWY